jgi:hypothetical protein
MSDKEDGWTDLGTWEFVQDTRSGEMGFRNARTGEVFLHSDLDELIEQLSDEDAVLIGDPIESTEWALCSPNTDE